MAEPNDIKWDDEVKWDDAPAAPPSKARLLAKSLGEKGRAGVTSAASLGGLANWPLSRLGAAATYMRGGDARSWDERVKAESEALRGMQEQAAADSPTAATVGGLLGPVGLMKALPAAASAMAPISRLAQGMPTAGKFLAGTLDAGLFGAASAASRHSEDAGDASAAAASAASSPSNVYGGAIPVAMERALPMALRASGWLGEKADKMAWKYLIPPGQSTWARDAMEAPTLGSAEAAGRAFRTMKRDGAPVMTSDSKGTVRMLEAVDSDLGAKKGAIVKDADKAAYDKGMKEGAVDFDEAAADIVDTYNRHFGSVADNVKGTSVAAASEKARDLINEFFAKFRPGYRAISTQVEYPTPPQGELGLPGQTAKVSPGEPHLVPSEPGPPIAITRELRGATAERPLEVTSGATGERGQLGMFRTDTGQLYQSGKAAEVVPPRPERLYADTMRPAPDTGWGVAREHVPAEFVPGAPQTSFQGQTFTGNRVPDVGKPTARAVDVERRGIPVEEWERFKTNLQREVNDTSSVHGRPEVAIENNPTLRFLNDLGGNVKGAGERAIERTLGPEALAEFMATKRGIGTTKTLLPMAKGKVIAEDTPREMNLANAAGWVGHRLPFVVGGAASMGSSPTNAVVGGLAGLGLGSLAESGARASRLPLIHGLGRAEQSLANFPDLAPQANQTLAAYLAALRKKEEE